MSSKKEKVTRFFIAFSKEPDLRPGVYSTPSGIHSFGSCGLLVKWLSPKTLTKATLIWEILLKAILYHEFESRINLTYSIPINIYIFF